jgi:tetratricopeptide (TPR) repeat protein
MYWRAQGALLGAIFLFLPLATAVGGSGAQRKAAEQLEAAAVLVEDEHWQAALEHLRRMPPPPRKDLRMRAKQQVLLGRCYEGKKQWRDSEGAYRKAVKLAPKEHTPKLRLGRLLLRNLDGLCCGYDSPLGREVEKLMDKPARSTDVEQAAEAKLILARAFRAQPEKTQVTEDLLKQLENMQLRGVQRARVLIESGHFYLFHQMYPDAVHQYQRAHDALPKGSAAVSAVRDAAKQGGAMCMARQAKCDAGGKGPQCQSALKLFQEVPAVHMQGASWWMVSMLVKQLHGDVEGAVRYLEKAVEIVDDNADWWLKLGRLSQIVHHRLPEGGFQNRATKLARQAMVRAFQLNPFSAPNWTQTVDTLLETERNTGSGSVCKDPVGSASKGEGFLKPGETSAFTLYNADPDYSCDVIDVSEAPERFFSEYVQGHRPVIIRNATRDWPVPPSGWSERALAELGGDQVVEVAFTAADGHLNHFEPLKDWEHVFKDPHWQVNDRVLVRPKYEHLYFRDFLALLHRGGKAKQRDSYLHQTEMNMFFPDIARNMTKPPVRPLPCVVVHARIACGPHAPFVLLPARSDHEWLTRLSSSIGVDARGPDISEGAQFMDVGRGHPDQFAHGH